MMEKRTSRFEVGRGSSQAACSSRSPSRERGKGKGEEGKRRGKVTLGDGSLLRNLISISIC